MNRRNILLPAIWIPLSVAAVLAIGIVAIGELYLAIHGTGAIIAAVVLMTLIVAVAAFLAVRSERAHEAGPGGSH